MNVHFEILKLKKKFQLQIPFGSTFSYISELIFKHFGLNKNDYPDDKNARLKFIYKQIRCRYERTIESFNINSGSKIYISVPNFLLQSFSKEDIIEVDKTNIIKPIDQNQLVIPLSDRPLPPFNEEYAYLKIMQSINQAVLQQLICYGYDPKLAAYALVYHQDFYNAIDLLNLKVPNDPEFQLYVNLVYSKNVQIEELIQYDLKLSSVISKYTKENEYVRAAVCIKFYLFQVTNSILRNQLISFANQVEQRYPGQTQAMIHLYMTKRMRPMIFYQINITTRSDAEVSRKFESILLQIKDSTPENYRNPFVETYDDYRALLGQNPSMNIIEFGKSMNYDELKFLYQKCIVENQRMNYVINCIMASQGDLEAAQKLVYND